MILQIETAEILSLQINDANKTIVIRGVNQGVAFSKGIVRDLQSTLTYDAGKTLILQGKIDELCTTLLSIP